MIYTKHNCKDLARDACDILTESDIAKYLKPGDQVSIKPNLVVPGPASLGATTHPEIVEGAIVFLKNFGAGSIKIIESSWIGERTTAFKDCGYEYLSVKYGIPLIDLKTDSYTARQHNDLEIAVCDEALNTDFLLNIPVLKGHCQTRMTCCVKNLKGCVPDNEKKRFHKLGLHKPLAALYEIIKTGYCLVDSICGDLTSEDGGNPVQSDRLIAGRDPVHVDTYCAGLIGIDPFDVGYLRLLQG